MSALYEKLKGVELFVSSALLRDTSADILDALGFKPEPRLPGYPVRILDGNCLALVHFSVGLDWQFAAACFPVEFAEWLRETALYVRLHTLKKHSRSPKAPRQNPHTTQNSLMSRYIDYLTDVTRRICCIVQNLHPNISRRERGSTPFSHGERPGMKAFA